MRNKQHVGYRYIMWSVDIAPGLTAEQRARDEDAFAAAYDALPASQQPYAGWAETMAYLSRRIARRLRGEPVGDWAPPAEKH